MATNQIKLVINATDNSSTALKSLANNINNIKSGIASLGGDTTQATSGFSKLNTEAVKSPSIFSKASSVAKKLFGGITGWGKESNESIRDINESSRQSESLLQRVGNAAERSLGIFSGYKIVSGIFNMIGGQIQGAFSRLDTMDVFQRKMEMITGSADKATYALDKLKEATTGTPYALDAAAQAVQNFVVRGLETEDAVSSVSIWMDAVSAYGNGTTETFNSVIDAIGKMRTKGSVEMRYLNRLFAAGINPVQMYAKATNKSAEEVQNALSDKSIKTAEFLDTVETAMREGTNGVLVVEGMAKRLASTWSATFTNMRIAITRGWTTIISALNDSFKVFDENGLKGIIKSFGTTVEKVMGSIAGMLRTVLAPIMYLFKSIGDYWEHSFAKPFRESFKDFEKPIADLKKSISENLKGIRASFNEQWARITQDLHIEPIHIEFGKITNDVLAYVNEGLIKFRETVPDIMNVMAPAIKAGSELLTKFNKLIQVIVDNVIKLGQQFGKIVVPKAIPVLAKTLKLVETIIVSLTKALQKFITFLTPLGNAFGTVFGNLIDYIGQVEEAWTKWLESIDFQGILSTMGILVSNITDILTDATTSLQTFFGSFSKGQSFTQTISLNIEAPKTGPGGLEFVNIISKIFKNIVITVTRSIQALRPLLSGFFELFNGKGLQTDGLSNGLYQFLQAIEYATNVLSYNIPIWVNYFATFAVNVLQYVAPVGAFLWDLLVNYVIPFGLALFNAFNNVRAALLPVAEGILAVAFAVATVVVPPALQLLTGILNWIAANASLVVGAVLAIVAAILTFKLISFISDTVELAISAFMALKYVLISVLLPAVTTFFHVMATEGIVAAFANLGNPIFWIGLLVAAIVGLVAWLVYLWNTSEQARTVITRVFNVICDVFKTVIYVAFFPIIVAIQAVVAAFNWLMEKCQPFADAVNGVKDALTGWWDWLTGKDVAGKTQETVENGNAQLKAGSEGMYGVGQDYMNNFNTGLQDYMPDTSTMGTDVATGFQQSMQTTMDASQLDTSTYLAQLNQMGENSQEIGGSIPTGIAEGLNANSQSVQDSMNNIVGGMSNTLNTAFSSEQVTGSASNLINTIAIVFTEQAPLLYQTTGNIGAGAVNEFVAKVNENAINAYATAIALMSQFKMGIDEAFNFVRESVALGAATLAQQFAGLDQQFYLYGNSSITQFSAGFNLGVPLAIENQQAFRQQLIQDLELLPQSTYGVGRSTVEAFKNGVADNQDQIIQSFDELVSQLRSNIANDLNLLTVDMVTIATDMMDQFNRAMADGADQVVATTDVKRVEIANAMDAIVNDFGDIAEDAMDELAKGIEDKTQSVVDVTNELVQKLKDTFITGLGIHSPSRFMQYVGQMMAAGLISGLTQDQIQTWVEGIVSQMRGSFDKGTLDPFSTVDFLGDDTVALIGYLTGVDTSAAQSQANNGQLTWPIPGYEFHVNSPFGNRASPGGIGSRNHEGVDLMSGHGNPIVAALPGTVSVSGPYFGYGNAVVLDHGNGVQTRYAHFLGTAVSVGQSVQAGQTVGFSDSTGNSTGDHLHFEIRQNGTPVDPVPYLQGAAQVSGVLIDPLANMLQMVYNKYQSSDDKMHWRDGMEGMGAAQALMGGIVGGGFYNTAGSGLIEPDWFKQWSPSPEVARWSSVVSQALTILGEPQALLKGVLYAIEHESSGNPTLVNNWDSNAMMGDPTKGLLQIMTANFKPRSQGGWGVEGYTSNIWDPLQNILTGLGEMKWKPIYASQGGIAGVINRRLALGVNKWSGYAVGSTYVPFDMMAPVHQGEAIIPASQNPYTNSGGDYLRQLITHIFNNDDQFGNIDTSGLGSNNTYNTEQNINVDAPISITINGDADSQEIADNLSPELHRVLTEAIAVGNPR